VHSRSSQIIRVALGQLDKILTEYFGFLMLSFCIMYLRLQAKLNCIRGDHISYANYRVIDQQTLKTVEEFLNSDIE
jgi:hypothetical protein